MIPPYSLQSIPGLYHFTDWQNLPLIRQYGGLWPLACLKRGNVAIPAAGGNLLSQTLDQQNGMDEYVHLCFRATHPMAFVAQNEGRITNCIYLEIHPHILTFPNVMFTDEVANKTGVVPHPIATAESMIDYQVLYTRTDWHDPAIMERLKRAEKCEVLVPHQIPLNYIRNMPNG